MLNCANIFLIYLNKEAVLMILNNEEMFKVEGGSNTLFYSQLAIVGGLITFLAGILDGVLHPKKCERS